MTICQGLISWEVSLKCEFSGLLVGGMYSITAILAKLLRQARTQNRGKKGGGGGGGGGGCVAVGSVRGNRKKDRDGEATADLYWHMYRRQSYV